MYYLNAGDGGIAASFMSSLLGIYGGDESKMAIVEVTIDHQKDVTYCYVQGEITMAEIIGKMNECYDNKPTRFFIWDVSEGSVMGLTAEALRKISREMNKFLHKREGGKTALVSSRDGNFGMGRMYEAYAHMERLPVEYKTFRSIEAAEQWLNP